MQTVSRTQYNNIVQNYEHVYFQLSKHIQLPPLDKCRNCFTTDNMIAMFEKRTHFLKCGEVKITDIITFKKYSKIVIACECEDSKGDKELPWDINKLPPKEFLLSMLYKLNSNHYIFSKNPSDDLGVQESQYQLRQETINLLQGNAPLNPYRASVKKRTKKEREELALKKVEWKKMQAENALALQEKAVEFKKKQIQKYQQAYQELQNNNQNQNNQMIDSD